MLSLVTVSPVTTAFHSCCRSHHVFDQVNLAGLDRNWNHYVLTILAWSCRDSTPQSAAPRPRKVIRVGFFGLINPIVCSPCLVFHSRVRTEFVIVFNWNHFQMRLLNLRINFLKIYCGLFVLILVVFVLFLLHYVSAKLHSQRFTWSKTWCYRQQLWKAVITGDTVASSTSKPTRVSSSLIGCPFHMALCHI